MEKDWVRNDCIGFRREAPVHVDRVDLPGIRQCILKRILYQFGAPTSGPTVWLAWNPAKNAIVKIKIARSQLTSV